MGGRGRVPVRKHPTLLQVFLQVGEEGLGVGPFKKEGKGLKPQRGHFPSWTPEGARALRGLKDRAWAGYGGRRGSSRGSGPEEIGLGKRSSRGYLALPPAPAPRRLGGGRGKGERGEARMGERRGAATPGSGGQRGKRGERLLKDLKPGRSGAPSPPASALPSAPSPPGPAGQPSRLQPRGVQASPSSSSSSAASSAGRGGGRESRVRSPRGPRKAPEPRKVGVGAVGDPACPLASHLPPACPQATKAGPLPTHLRAAP